MIRYSSRTAPARALGLLLGLVISLSSPAALPTSLAASPPSSTPRLPLAELAIGDSSSAFSASTGSPVDAGSEPVGPGRTGTPTTPAGYTPGLAPFVVRVGEEVIPYRLMAVFVQPDTWVRIEVLRGQPGSTYRLRATRGAVVPLTSRLWAWNAPSTPGLYPVHVTGKHSDMEMTLQAFVLEPFETGQTSLNGYRIGRYRPVALGGDEAYDPPDGFVRVTEGMQDVPVSPHFTLGQFLCKQTEFFPQYALVRTRLLIKLEMILQAVNDAGHEATTLAVQSAFRTPFHNHAIGARTDYSRHLYGDAADVFVDADGDGWMDDLNRDGRRTKADARVLARLVQNVEDRLGIAAFAGGTGVYGPPDHRNAFVHVDTRGSRVQW